MPDPLHPAIAPRNIAIVTGAASGIGLEMAKRLASLGMSVWMVDPNAAALKQEASKIDGDVRISTTDVSDMDAMGALRDQVLNETGAPHLLMNNAVIRGGAKTWENLDLWKDMMDVNYWGVVHGVHAFVPAMLEDGGPRAVINVGSKQGITSPPGKPPYNVPKSAVKTYSELLAHDLRNEDGAEVTAHLLIPGMTTTGTREHSDGAWWPEEVVDYMLPRIARGDFYILCPDGEVTPDMDAKRIQWAYEDITQNRPALSRWHADWKTKFSDR